MILLKLHTLNIESFVFLIKDIKRHTSNIKLVLHSKFFIMFGCEMSLR